MFSVPVRIRTALAVTVLASAVPVFAAQASDQFEQLRAEADRLASQQVRRAHAAVPLYEQAITLARRSGDTVRLAATLLSLGEALRATNQPEAAAAAVEQARDLAKRAHETTLEADAWRVLGILAVEAGQFERAEQLLSRGLAIARGSSDAAKGRGIEVAILNSLSVAARHEGRLLEAKKHAEAALELLERARAERHIVPDRLSFQVPFNVGKSLATAGDFATALTYFDQAFRAAEALGFKGGQWHALFDTAEWYLAQGDIDRAARYHERALALSRTMDSRDMEAHSLRGSGSVAEAQGRLPAAIDFYTGALGLMDRIRLAWDAPETLVARARVRFAVGDQMGADADIREALARATAAKEHIGLAHARLERARQLLESRQFPAAVAEYHDGLRIARASGVLPLVPVALAGLGHAARRQGDFEGAVHWYRASADAAGTIRGHIPSLDLRTAFADAVHGTFSWLLESLLQLHARSPAAGHDREAFRMLEWERSQTFLQTLNAGAPAASHHDRRLERLRVTRAELQTALWSSGSSSRRNYLLARLDDVDRSIAALVGAPYDTPAPPSDEELIRMRRVLDRRETLIQFARAGDRWVAFVVDRENLKVVPIASVPDLAERVESFNRLLQAGDAHAAVAVGRSIASVFVDPLLDDLGEVSKVLLFGVAGPAAAIPFGALPVESRARPATPLIAHYELGYVPSLSALADLRRRGPAVGRRTLLAFADPGGLGGATRSGVVLRSAPLGTLPYSGAEVRAAARYAGDADVLLGQHASESTFKARYEAFRILHFATHALLDPGTPSRSALLLSGSETEDGLLQAGEIQRLARGPDLVVLSACQSAGGRPSTTEGVLSLARAFIYAGARSVVGSHWDVNDRSSATLIERFYASLASGRTVSAALREAQLESAGSDPYRTAAHWAGFMAVGDPRADPRLPRQPGHAGSVMTTLAGAAVALLALFLLTVRPPRTLMPTGWVRQGRSR